MNEPSISIILPSVRPVQLTRCLTSIERHTSGISYEVVVISPFDIEQRPNVVHIRETKSEGVYRAVAAGCERARGEYLIHMPDDSRATPRWATNMIAFMRPHDDEVFEGGFHYFDVYGEKPGLAVYGKLYAPFLCIRRDKVDRLGGLMDCYYRSFFGDPDLSLRVWQSGGKVAACPNAWVYHADCNDDSFRKSQSSYFYRDQDAFVRRWHHIYGRAGESFTGSRPVRSQALSRELPPEKCTRLYLSMVRWDWKTTRNLLISNTGDECVYPEGLPVLHNYVMKMLKLLYAPRVTLTSVLGWIQRQGFVPLPTDDVPIQESPLLRRIWGAMASISFQAVSIALLIMSERVLRYRRADGLELVRWLEKRHGLAESLSERVNKRLVRLLVVLRERL